MFGVDNTEFFTLNLYQEERDNNLMDTMDAEATAAKALNDLANAEEEIKALEDLLKAHEREESVSHRAVFNVFDFFHISNT